MRLTEVHQGCAETLGSRKNVRRKDTAQLTEFSQVMGRGITGLRANPQNHSDRLSGRLKLRRIGAIDPDVNRDGRSDGTGGWCRASEGTRSWHLRSDCPRGRRCALPRAIKLSDAAPARVCSFVTQDDRDKERDYRGERGGNHRWSPSRRSEIRSYTR